jgi:hypothetical protein
MNDAHMKFSEEVAAKLIERFESEDIKKLVEDTKAANDSGTFEVVATTENLDRYQEVIKLDGWQLEHYRSNPVVLWGHNRLIGMATSVDIVDGKMIVKGKFAPTEEGQEKRKLYDLGFLRATSVGFIEKEREGNLITKAELLELSFVSVPANPYALKLSMDKGLSINELVTKGIMTVEEKQEAPVETPETPQNEPENEEEPEVDTKAIPAALGALKAAVVALEALSKEAPEGDEDEPEEPSEEEKALAEFAAMRKTVQDAATVLGDVLAEARRAIEARK